MATGLRIWLEQYNTIKKLPSDQQKDLALAILDYAFTGNHDPLPMIADIAITPMKPSLTLKDFGGAPTGNKNNRYSKEKYNPCTTLVQPLYNPCTTVVKNTCTTINNNKTETETETENKTDILSMNFTAGYQGWGFKGLLLIEAKKHWSTETIRKIEINFSCQEFETKTSIKDLLNEYPSDISKKFIKPTLDQIKAYCKERNNNVNAQEFLDKYDSNGWKVGTANAPMKDWKATVRYWERPKSWDKKNNTGLRAGTGNMLKDGDW